MASSGSSCGICMAIGQNGRRRSWQQKIPHPRKNQQRENEEKERNRKRERERERGRKEKKVMEYII